MPSQRGRGIRSVAYDPVQKIGWLQPPTTSPSWKTNQTAQTTTLMTASQIKAWFNHG